MGKFRGFLVKQRIRTVFRCLAGRHRSPISYRVLNSSSPCKPISRLFRWTRKLRSKVKSICCVTGRITGREYMEIGREQVIEKQQTPAVPKGYMPVYVGQKDGDFERVLVPVIYFNDPLFGQLLRDAEEEFGFDHPGAITIPCRISEFEHVQTRIKEGHGTRKILRGGSDTNLQLSCI